MGGGENYPSMKVQIAITDLTRMQRGCVCVAGYDREGRCYRPILPPPGILEKSLLDKFLEPVIFPFAVVEYDFIKSRSQPPHTEDYIYNPDSVIFVKEVLNRERVLNLSLFENVEAIFEQTIYDDVGFYVMDGCGPRSTGTILPNNIVQVRYESGKDGNWDYRLHFYDRINRFFRLKITDLTWHYYCDSLRNENNEPNQIAHQLTQLLKTRKVYLRIGLSRGWNKYPDRCYLQINAIHTFPDYLEGKTFANLKKH